MRGIKFRAKSTTSEHFVFGSLVYNYLGFNKYYIHSFELGMTEVDCDTIGQYTGLKDLNGNEIFEGDIMIRDEKTVVVSFVDQCFLLAHKYESGGREYESHFFLSGQCKVIGNIHQNPELC